MEIKIDPNHFYAGLHKKIADDLTPERLATINKNYWDDLIREQQRELGNRIFQRLSTPRKVKWLKGLLNAEVFEQRKIMASDMDFYFRDAAIKRSEDRKKEIQREIFRLDPPPIKEGFIGVTEIDRAKAVPITEHMEFRHKKAVCLWHDDRHPSLYYYERDNVVKCFSCGFRGDVVDVVQKLYDLSFIDAVKKLIT